MDGESCLPEEFALLRGCLGSVRDPRHARGRVHLLVNVLCLVVLALMAGARSLSDISRWGKLHPEVLGAVQLRRSPSVATLGRLLRMVSVQEVRSSLLTFARELGRRRDKGEGLHVVAADGKTLRGVWQDGKQLHVLHLFAHKAALALDQVGIQWNKDEVEATKSWLEQIAREVPGLAILTGDAMLADGNLCSAIVQGRRDYVIRLKNQPELYSDAEVLFAEPGRAEFVKVEKGHGRLEKREIRTSGELEGYSDFPGLKQVEQIKKRVVFLKTGKIVESMQYLLTSFSAMRAGPQILLSLIRGHWGIENRLFHIKDDSFGEDRHVLCSHRSGEVMSLLRATATNLLRGNSHLWTKSMPLTGRAQCVCAHPLAVLNDTS